MAYIGSPPASQAFEPGTDTFSGTGSQTAFTLTRNVATVNDILVVVDNVEQPVTAYTVSASTLTFNTAPASGTNNVYVRYLSTNLVTIAPQQGSVTKQSLDVASGGLGTGAVQLPTGTTAQRPSATIDGYTRFNTTTGLLEFWDGSAWASGGGGGASTPADVSDQANTSTGYFSLPAGTTAQRPVSPQNGASRYNTTTGFPEYWDGNGWYQFNSAKTYTASYLIVAGGGGGGATSVEGAAGGAGAGAGGLLTGTFTLSSGTTYSFVVGSGGAASSTSTASGSNGNNSTGLGLTAIGGGGGSSAGDSNTVPGNGGSGGGSGGKNSPLAAGTGTAGQGNNGGQAVAASTYKSGGGGGASAVGFAGNVSSGGGGAGTASSITGSSVTYAGGGASGNTTFGGAAGTGGAGGGGNGGSSAVGVSGTANTGGGGGGGGSGAVRSGGNGGSGVIIISIPTANYTAITTGSPTITTNGSNTVLKFTSSGSYTA